MGEIKGTTVACSRGRLFGLCFSAGAVICLAEQPVKETHFSGNPPAVPLAP